MSGLQIGFAVDEYQRTVMRGKSLQLGAVWDVTLAERANGLVRVFREGGDFILQGDSPVALGLETLELNLAAQEDRLALSALVSGKRVGAINFAGTALARRQGSSVSLDPDAALTGVGHVEVPALDWLGPVIDQNLRTGGSVVGDFNIIGTAARPQSSGHIVGNKLSIALADQGLRLRDGIVDLNFDAARVSLGKLDFRADRSLAAPDSRLRVLNLPGAEGGAAKDDSGRISGSGGIDLKTGLGAFELLADHVPVLQRADQWALVSGTVGIASGWEHMDINAKLRADAGFFGVPKSGAPSLGDDVLVRGRQAKPPQRMRVNLDVDFDFGRNFIVKAWGIDTWLDGELRVQLAQGQQPRATGALRTREGVFEAYGQNLAIDRGLINFSGPLDNPALNVVAVRKGLAVEAGVEVTGLAKQPRARLVSEPEVPDSEKLSWILLGRSSDAEGGDAGLLIAAASAAFSGEGPAITTRVANTFGFDDVSLGQGGMSSRPVQSRVASNSTGSSSATSGTVNGQVISLGKHLSAKAYLALEQNLEGTESIVKFTYKLTRYLSVIARGGTDNSLDLSYTISFD
jgi:translocation and assembly module TamB